MNRRLVMFLMVQAVGAIFYCVLSAAYFIPFPSFQVLIGEPVFKLLLTVFGGAFLVLTLASLAAFRALKKA